MTTQERHDYWKSHIEGQQQSGQCITDYCLSHRLNGAAFYKWRKRFTTTEPAVPSSFTRVKLPRPTHAAVLTFGLTRLELPMGTGLESLAQLMLQLNGKV